MHPHLRPLKWTKLVIEEVFLERRPKRGGMLCCAVSVSDSALYSQLMPIKKHKF